MLNRRVKAPDKEVYRNNNETIVRVQKNGNISFVEQNKKKVGTLCVLTFLNVFI